MSEQPLNSSPCMMGDIDPAYHGLLNRDELLTLLYSLLHAERAGARVCALSLRDVATADQRRLLRAIHQDEVKSCRQLMASLNALGATPDKAIGDFLEKCLAIDDITQRLELLNKGQRWVERKISEALPKVQQQQVQRQLAEMLDDHRRNIDLLDNVLASPPTSAV